MLGWAGLLLGWQLTPIHPSIHLLSPPPPKGSSINDDFSLRTFVAAAEGGLEICRLYLREPLKPVRRREGLEGGGGGGTGRVI